MLRLLEKPLALAEKLMAARCEACPACRYARKNPETLFGRLVQWHGSWCPCWKAWEKHHGDEREAPAP